jgi:hypothetical protein
MRSTGLRAVVCAGAAAALLIVGVISVWLLAGVGLHRRWRGGRLAWLLPWFPPVALVAGWYAAVLVGCGG